MQMQFIGKIFLVSIVKSFLVLDGGNLSSHFFLKASNNFNFQSFSNISNDYAGINLYKGPYFLKLTSNSCIWGRGTHRFSF